MNTSIHLCILKEIALKSLSLRPGVLFGSFSAPTLLSLPLGDFGKDFCIL